MKTRLPLSLKIFLLAFLNVALLAAVFVAFARFQFRLDLSSFLLAPARDRMLSASHQIGLQFLDSNRSDWNQILARNSASYSADLFLFDEDAQQLAGAAVTLPPPLIDAFHHFRFDRGRFGPGAFAGGPPFIHREERPPGSPQGAPLRRPMEFIKTANPTRYWFGVEFPLFNSAGPHPTHARLIWRFSSLWFNPLVFDYKPWAAVVLAVVLLSMVCWLPFIRGLTRSIRQLTLATGQIAEGRFEVSLPLHRRDELGQLNHSIHRMAERLSGFVHGQKRFLGDIAHELCSPVARMQMAMGILEQRAENEQAEYVADVQAELEHMSTLINELLAFSKAQINTSGTALTAVNVADTVRRVLERESSADAQIETDVSGAVEVMAHPDYLFRSLANLVRNAIRYAGQAGPIVVSASNGGEDVLISIADSGPGLPEAELENVFKPFYRPEYARQRETGGIGLGLAIVRSCVEACGGSVRCRNRLPKGLIVDISLPAVKAA